MLFSLSLVLLLVGSASSNYNDEEFSDVALRSLAARSNDNRPPPPPPKSVKDAEDSEGTEAGGELLERSVVLHTSTRPPPPPKSVKDAEDAANEESEVEALETRRWRRKWKKKAVPALIPAPAGYNVTASNLFKLLIVISQSGTSVRYFLIRSVPDVHILIQFLLYRDREVGSQAKGDRWNRGKYNSTIQSDPDLPGCSGKGFCPVNRGSVKSGPGICGSITEFFFVYVDAQLCGTIAYNATASLYVLDCELTGSSITLLSQDSTLQFCDIIVAFKEENDVTQENDVTEEDEGAVGDEGEKEEVEGTVAQNEEEPALLVERSVVLHTSTRPPPPPKSVKDAEDAAKEGAERLVARGITLHTNTRPPPPPKSVKDAEDAAREGQEVELLVARQQEEEEEEHHHKHHEEESPDLEIDVDVEVALAKQKHKEYHHEESRHGNGNPPPFEDFDEGAPPPFDEGEIPELEYGEGPTLHEPYQDTVPEPEQGTVPQQEY
eukprot:sb/3464156/